jgi:uncharacterized membrane protein (UPF0127 family)
VSIFNPLRWIAARIRARKRLLHATLRVTDETRGTELASRLKTASTSAQRNRGLLGRDALGSGEGLWIVPCQAVHTFFMRFPIDLVYLDRQLRVRKIKKHVRPWRISFCFAADSVLELPAGATRAAETVCGDQLLFEEVPAAESAAVPA